MIQDFKASKVELKDLKPNKNCPLVYSEKDLHKYAHAIQHFKFTPPIIVDDDLNIISGNAKYEAFKLLGIKEVQVASINHLSDADIKAFVISEGKFAKLAEWDMDILKADLQYLTELGYDTSVTGFDIADIDLIINDIVIESSEDDELPNDADIEVRSKLGDLWQLGEHKLFNGDALKHKSYEILFDKEKANIAFVDYPYNVKISDNVTKNKNHKEFKQASGEMTKEQFTDFLKNAMNLQKEFSNDGSIHYGCMDWRHIEEITVAGNHVFEELKNVCVWDKGTAGMGSLYRSQHELVFVFKNGTKPHINNIELGIHGRYRTNVWNYKGMHASNPQAAELSKLHPTVKPTAMIMDALLDCSKPNDIVLDNFGGSGSTLIAAEKLKRKARLIEIDPHYCDVIIYRWERLTNKKAKLLTNVGE